MPITNKPTVTALQVGATAYFIENNQPRKADIVATKSIITDADVDGTAEESVMYYLDGYPQPKLSTLVFADAAALKTAFGGVADAL